MDGRAQSRRKTGKCARNRGVGSGGRIRTDDPLLRRQPVWFWDVSDNL